MADDREPIVACLLWDSANTTRVCRSKTSCARVTSFPLSLAKGKGEVRGIRLRRKERGTEGEVTYQVLTGLEKGTKLLLTIQKPEDRQGA
jgi:hypothetical protein